MFRNLFLVLAQDADPAGCVVCEDALSVTTIVPVPDVAAAVSVVAQFGAVDLIELYGGLGIDAAAAVLAVAPQAAVGFAGDVTPAAGVAVLFEDPGASPSSWTFGTTTVVAVPTVADAPAVAVGLVAAGATRIELCGGMGPVPAAAVRAVVDVPVTTVLFGFESLPAAAAYRAAFEKAASSLTPNG